MIITIGTVRLKYTLKPHSNKDNKLTLLCLLPTVLVLDTEPSTVVEYISVLILVQYHVLI